MSENSTHLRITDLPYRCPQCHKNGKINDFASLPSLKDHLKDQHGYRYVRLICIRSPKSRVVGNDYNNSRKFVYCMIVLIGGRFGAIKFPLYS